MRFNYKKLILLPFCFFLILVPSNCNNPFSSDKSDLDPVLSVNKSVLYFGKTLTENFFTISNAGGRKANKTPRTLEWWIEFDSTIKWFGISPDAGTDADSIKVTLNRLRLSSGEHSSILTVHSNGGTKEIKVHAVGQ